MLLEHLSQSEVDLAGFGEVTALHVAVMRGHLDMVSLLTEAGASLSAGDLVTFSALHYAAWWGRAAIAEYLLGREEAGEVQQVASLSCVGDTPLHLATWKGELKICRLLVERTGEVNVLDGEHHSPVHIAAFCGHEAILSLLTQPRLKPRVQEVTIYQDTPLHLASYSGKTEAARILLAASPPDILRWENIWSETPLHAACTSGKSKELVNFLLGEHWAIFIISWSWCQSQILTVLLSHQITPTSQSTTRARTVTPPSTLPATKDTWTSSTTCWREGPTSTWWPGAARPS